MEKSELPELKDFTEHLVKKAGEIILAGQGKFKVVNQKDVRDVATNVDIEVERFILDSIRSKYPNHSIFSEEEGLIGPKSDYKWVVDPLDGTKQYVRDLPYFSSNLCLTFEEKPIVSAVYFPLFNRLYSAALGLGAYVNGRQTNLSVVKKLDESFVYVYIPTMRRKYVSFEDAWDNVIKLSKVAYRVKSESGVSWALSFLADGGMEAFLNLSNPEPPHDLLPGLLIATEAGAIVKKEKDRLIAANNLDIYNQIMEIING